MTHTTIDNFTICLRNSFFEVSFIFYYFTEEEINIEKVNNLFEAVSFYF